MTTKEFNKRVAAICLKYDFKFKPEYDDQIRYVGSSPFGQLQIISSPSPRIKFYTVFMKFLESFDLADFYEHFSKNEAINPYSKKWNLHNNSPEYVLNELDERLNNLTVCKPK